MKHTVYLPDEISERAKAAGLNLSGLLRGVVDQELTSIESLEDSGAIRIELDERIINFEGVYLDSGSSRAYYLKADGAVLIYDADRETYFIIEGVDLGDQLPEALAAEDDDVAQQVYEAVGMKPEVWI